MWWRTCRSRRSNGSESGQRIGLWRGVSWSRSIAGRCLRSGVLSFVFYHIALFPYTDTTTTFTAHALSTFLQSISITILSLLQARYTDVFLEANPNQCDTAVCSLQSINCPLAKLSSFIGSHLIPPQEVIDAIGLPSYNKFEAYPALWPYRMHLIPPRGESISTRHRSSTAKPRDLLSSRLHCQKRRARRHHCPRGEVQSNHLEESNFASTVSNVPTQERYC
jgi:hypothetical protein